MKLTRCVSLFLTRYLPDIRGVKPNTVRTYKDAFRGFIPYASRYLSKKVSNIDVADLSTDLVIDFLDHLENDAGNKIVTRNNRLAAIRSMTRMIRLMAPEDRETADRILNIPSKRSPKPLFGFLSHDEALAVFDSVDLKRKQGFRDYTILHLLYDSGARAHEIAGLCVDDFDPNEMRVGILGKGGRFRIVQIWTRTADLIVRYIKEHREKPMPAFRNRLFVNQRGQGLTRSGVYRICQKYLKKTLPENRLKDLNAAHCFRHSCAIHMLMCGSPISDIKNHLGHEDINSTMIYLRLDLSRRREVQKRFIEYTKTILKNDPKIDELIDWENNKDEILKWLDSL
ncbi:MAG: tyrosine-type recombinase/integrase [Planctomycetaceae bacterium]|nr:tyrosine-type recombinase/integrase [Planctomycetaceae bacterium]